MNLLERLVPDPPVGMRSRVVWRGRWHVRRWEAWAHPGDFDGWTRLGCCWTRAGAYWRASRWLARLGRVRSTRAARMETWSSRGVSA